MPAACHSCGLSERHRSLLCLPSGGCVRVLPSQGGRWGSLCPAPPPSSVRGHDACRWWPTCRRPLMRAQLPLLRAEPRCGWRAATGRVSKHMLCVAASTVATTAAPTNPQAKSNFLWVRRGAWGMSECVLTAGPCRPCCVCACRACCCWRPPWGSPSSSAFAGSAEAGASRSVQRHVGRAHMLRWAVGGDAGTWSRPRCWSATWPQTCCRSPSRAGNPRRRANPAPVIEAGPCQTLD
jgi:hypothetical protein